MSALILPIKGVYFDQIAAGVKTEEYRLPTSYWQKRIQGRSYDTVVLLRGYPKAGGIEGQTRLTRRWRGYRMTRICHPHFGTVPVTVFAINVEVSA